jgi:hypothetical protein
VTIDTTTSLLVDLVLLEIHRQRLQKWSAYSLLSILGHLHLLLPPSRTGFHNLLVRETWLHLYCTVQYLHMILRWCYYSCDDSKLLNLESHISSSS